MITVNTHEAKTKLSKRLSLVEEKGETIKICINGKPIAELVPIQASKDPMKLHPSLSKIKIIYDPLEPLSGDEWPDDKK